MYTVIVKYGIYLFFRGEICSTNTLFVNDGNIVESNCSQLACFFTNINGIFSAFGNNRRTNCECSATVLSFYHLQTTFLCRHLLIATSRYFSSNSNTNMMIWNCVILPVTIKGESDRETRFWKRNCHKKLERIKTFGSAWFWGGRSGEGKQTLFLFWPKVNDFALLCNVCN